MTSRLKVATEIEMGEAGGCLIFKLAVHLALSVGIRDIPTH